MNTYLKYLFVLFVTALLAGCIGGSTKPSSFFSLSATEANQSTNISRSGGIGLRLGPFTFPDYLRRPNIITRTSDNRIMVDEFQRWGGSLEDDFHRVLGTNLGTLLESGNISVYPADSRMNPKYKIMGEINTFEGYLGEKVILDIRWFVIAPKSENVFSSKQSVIIEPVEGKTHAAMVQAQSRAVGRLSREISAELKRIDVTQ